MGCVSAYILAQQFYGVLNGSHYPKECPSCQRLRELMTPFPCPCHHVVTQTAPASSTDPVLSPHQRQPAAVTAAHAPTHHPASTA